MDAIGFNAGFKYIKVYIHVLPICHEKHNKNVNFNDQLDACLTFFFLAVDLIQHKYLDILYNYLIQ
jgi:hypothetical protein